MAAHVPQTRLRFAMLAGGDDGADTHVRPERKQAQQQSPTQRIAIDHLTRRHRGELAGELGQVVGVLQHIEQVQGSPTADHLVFDPAQIRRFRQRLQPRHHDPRFAAAGGDRDARAARDQGLIQPGEGIGHAPSQSGNELGRVQRLAQRGVVHLASGIEIAG